MFMHTAEDLLECFVRADISDRVEQTISSIKRSAPNFELRHVLQLKLNLGICGLLSRTREHIRRIVGGDDLVTALLELQGVRTCTTRNFEQTCGWSNSVLTQTPGNERCFRLIRLIGVKEIVKFSVSA